MLVGNMLYLMFYDPPSETSSRVARLQQELLNGITWVNITWVNITWVNIIDTGNDHVTTAYGLADCMEVAAWRKGGMFEYVQILWK